MNGYSFTSESVSEGHPDKLADQISDAILDSILSLDRQARVACETYIKSDLVLIGGEITTTAQLEIDRTVRKTLRAAGYLNRELGIDAEHCTILSAIGDQSSDIQIGIDRGEMSKQGAGDQGTVFGYATDETESLMPAPIVYAHRLMQRQAQCRRESILPWLRPDAKAQLTFTYDAEHTIRGISACVLSTQHDPGIELEALRKSVMEAIIRPVIPEKWLDEQTQYWINPTGRFVEGGPKGDCGLTGRKLMVDTYGGMARHGGGAFSGKDPSKVDRTGAYMARYIAKTLVSEGLAKRCEVQLSYAIGVSEPVAVNVDAMGTGRLPNHLLCRIVKDRFDLTPYGMIEFLDLLRPIYQKTAVYGHFGRSDFPWESLRSSPRALAVVGL